MGAKALADLLGVRLVRHAGGLGVACHSIAGADIARSAFESTSGYGRTHWLRKLSRGFDWRTHVPVSGLSPGNRGTHAAEARTSPGPHGGAEGELRSLPLRP